MTNPHKNKIANGILFNFLAPAISKWSFIIGRIDSNPYTNYNNKDQGTEF